MSFAMAALGSTAIPSERWMKSNLINNKNGQHLVHLHIWVQTPLQFQYQHSNTAAIPTPKPIPRSTSSQVDLPQHHHHHQHQHQPQYQHQHQHQHQHQEPGHLAQVSFYLHKVHLRVETLLHCLVETQRIVSVTQLKINWIKLKLNHCFTIW